jgi:Tfp pilus assembly protein PilF
LTDFNEAISLDPNYAQAYANRAMVSRQTNKLELALADYNHALTIDPNYAVGYVGRGMVYRQQAQPTQTLRDFNKAISIRPDAAPAYLNSRFALSTAKSAPARDRRFHHRHRSDPEPGRAVCGPRLSGGGRAAASDFDDAVAIEPQNIKAWTSRGFAYERLGDNERANGSSARATQSIL